MKSEYFVLMPNDICCSFCEILISYRVENEKGKAKISSQTWETATLGDWEGSKIQLN